VVAQAVEEQVEQPAGPPIDARHGVAAYALDPDAAARLWQVSIDTLAS